MQPVKNGLSSNCIKYLTIQKSLTIIYRHYSYTFDANGRVWWDSVRAIADINKVGSSSVQWPVVIFYTYYFRRRNLFGERIFSQHSIYSLRDIYNHDSRINRPAGHIFCVVKCAVQRSVWRTDKYRQYR